MYKTKAYIGVYNHIPGHVRGVSQHVIVVGQQDMVWSSVILAHSMEAINRCSIQVGDEGLLGREWTQWVHLAGLCRGRQAEVTSGEWTNM